MAAIFLVSVCSGSSVHLRVSTPSSVHVAGVVSSHSPHSCVHSFSSSGVSSPPHATMERTHISAIRIQKIPVNTLFFVFMFASAKMFSGTRVPINIFIYAYYRPRARISQSLM